MSCEYKLSYVEQYLRKLSGQEKECSFIDHNYPKAWNAYPDSNRMKPARMLFMKEIPRNSCFPDNRYCEEVDVISCDDPAPSPFDNQKTKLSANECEDLLKSHPFFADKENKNDLDLDSISLKQSQLYNDVIDLLNSVMLSRLAYNDATNELIKRKVMLEQAAAQMRQLFGAVFWDEDLLSWLHKTLVEDSDISLVASYLDILQILKAKLPSLVEKLLQSHSSTADFLNQILKKQWDPVIPILNHHKPKKLPRNPAFIICPSGPQSSNNQSPRFQFWQNSLCCLGKIISVPVFPSKGENQMTVEQCLDQIISSLRSKVSELKNHYPDKPVILVGWTIGALIACHVALLEPVDAIICLGFPLTGVNGSRGDLNDPLLDSQVPTLFVVGQNANMCSTDDIEDFRSRMQAESGLVVVGGGDDFLRVNSMKMLLENITQSMVDHCILDEVTDFLLSVFAKLPQSSTSQTALKTCSPIKEENSRSSEVQEGEKRKRRKPREYSPEIFPQRKKQKISPPVPRRPVSHVASTKSLATDSDSSSSEPTVAAKSYHAAKTAKKKHDKSIGRSSSNMWRRRLSNKMKVSNKSETSSGRTPKAEAEQYDPVKSIKTSLNSKASVPFSKHIFPKKNDPVDVEKAFGNDSKFLPRPLTPQEPEDTVSAEETEKVIAEMEAKADQNVTGATDSSVADLSHNQTTEKLDVLLQSSPLVFTSNTGSLSSPELKVVPTVSPVSNFGNVLQEDKTLTPSALKSLKSPSPVTLTESNPPSYKSPTKSTIITIPSVNAAKLLASSPTIKAQPGKMIQLLSKANIPVNIIRQDKTSSSTSHREASDPVGHTFIADISGESPKSGVKKMISTYPSPLARLAVASETQSHLGSKVVQKQMKTTPSHLRIETPEEIAEKNLAVQALNNSFGTDFPSTSSGEPGYSICYAKPDGSVISHTVTGPGYVHYLSKKNSLAALKNQRTSLGNNQTIPKKIFRYNK